MNKSINIPSIVITVLSVILTLGVVFIFHACGPKDDGSFMTCHWAERTVFGLGCVMLVISGAHCGARTPKMRTGLDLALIPAAVYTALVPGVVIDLCMMADMHCRAAMRPAVIIFSILIAVTAAADIALQSKKGDK